MTLFHPSTFAQSGSGDENPETLVNYPFTVGGTSFLNVGGQSVQAVRLPLSYTIRSLDDHTWGLKLRFPISVGLHEFTATDSSGGELSQRLSTVSGLAGAEFQLPAGRFWTLKPFVEVGAGKDLDGGAAAWIYSGGFNSVLSLRPNLTQYRIGAGVEYDGANLTGGGQNEAYTTLQVGLEIRTPFQKPTTGRQTDWGVYGVRRRFLSPLIFDQLEGAPIELENQTELGFTYGVDRPWKLWALRISRMGVGYKFGEGFASVRILFSAPF